MDKKLFELQVRHNYFVRYTIVSICKLVLWLFVFSLLTGATYYLSLIGLEWAEKNTYRPAEYTQKVALISLTVMILFIVVYLVIFVKTIMGIINEHKIATNAEKKVYKSVGNTLYKEMSAQYRQQASDEDEL